MTTARGPHGRLSRSHLLWGLLILFAGSCSHLKLGRQLRMSEADWPTYARSVNRSNATSESITPPLTVAWRNDITGGVGDGSPVVVDSLVVVGTLRGEIHVFDAANGRRLGWMGLGDAINGSPCVSGSIAYVGISNSDESLLAFDMMKGKPIWKQDLGDIEVSPLLEGERIFVGNLRGEFFCVDCSDGAKIWTYKVPENRKVKGIRSTPAMSDSTIVFGCDDGFVYALNASDGTERWKVDTGDPVFASVSIVDGVSYVGSVEGNIVAVDIMSGKVLWKKSLGSGFRGGLAVAEDLILVPTLSGKLFGLDKATGDHVWMTDLGSVLNSAPVVSGKYVYIGTLRKILYGLDFSDGSVVVQEVVEGRIKTPPAVAFGKLYVATDERWIIAFEGEMR